MQYLALSLLIYIVGVVTAAPTLELWKDLFPTNEPETVVLELHKGDFAYAILHNPPKDVEHGAPPYQVRLVYGGHLGFPPQLPEGNQDLADNVAVLVYETAIKPFPSMVKEIEQAQMETSLDKELNMK